MPLTIYKSSAGSGKTYTLVLEYLLLVLRNTDNVKNTLAVTFTNKATEEMKGRIVKALVSLADGNDLDLANMIHQRLAIDEKEIQKRAAIVLSNLLHNYTRFSVMTIDSFFNSVVSSISKELQIPLNFELELKQDAVQQAILDQLFLSIENDVELKKILTEFSFAKMDDDAGWNIQKELSNMAKELFKNADSLESRLNNLPQDVDGLISKLRTQKSTFEKKMLQYSQQFFQLMVQYNLTPSDFKYGKSGFANWFNKIADLPTLKEYELGTRLMAAYEDENMIFSDKKSPQAQNNHTVTQIHRCIVDAVDAFRAGLKDYINAMLALKLLHTVKVYSRLHEQLKLYRKENSVLLMNDIATTINNFVSNDDASFIYEKTGSRFLNCFIDEFQDTSNVQWRNFLPVIENIIAAGNECLIVGDVKQSIYRWRGGNMHLLATQVSKDLQHFDGLITTKQLNTNYRSAENIVSFNNFLFGASAFVLQNEVENATLELIKSTYGEEFVTQQLSPAKTNINKGCVKIDWIENKRKKAEEKSNENDVEIEDENFNTLTLNNLHQDIQLVIEKGFKYKDITILVRTKANGATVAEYLQQHGIINLITPESFYLASSIKISFIIAYLEFCNNAHNVIAKHTMLRCYNQLFQLENDSTDFEILFSQFIETGKHNAHGVDEMAIALINHFKINTTPDAYITRFMDVLHQLRNTNIITLPAILQWWADNKYSDAASVILPEDYNAISIMTIHKSKGLQFPIVMMPFLNWSVKPKSNEVIWVQTPDEPFNNSIIPVNIAEKKMLLSSFAHDYNIEKDHTIIDSLNTLYVAFTRAEQALFIYTQQLAKSPTINRINALLSNLINNSELRDSILKQDATMFFGDIEMLQPWSKENGKANTAYQLQGINLQPMGEKFQPTFTSAKRKMFALSDTKIQYGLALHDILSSIDDKVEVDQKLQTWVRLNEVDVETQKKLRHDISNIMAMPQLDIFFNKSNTVFAEKEIYFDGNFIRPDRVAVNGDTAYIIDYKTGEPDKAHLLQVNKYANALIQMGYKVESKYILYTEKINLVSA